MKSFKTESKKLLDLMVNSIYANREVFLRELVSNASDALDKVRLARMQGAPGSGEGGDLEIRVTFDRARRLLTVSDTGVGMDDAALEECLGTIAHSGSQQVKERLARGQAPSDVDIIGQFGVGFYSSFMVADRVTVVSRSLGDEQAWCWESDGVEGYSIEPAERPAHGTDVTLHIRESTADENLERFLDQSSLQNLIRRYSNYIRYPIVMDLARETFDEQSGALQRDESVVTPTVVNAMTPIWTLDEQDVTEEELEEFYRFEFRDPEPPLRTIRARARGAIEYDALLFVPSTAPEELYSKDYRYGPRLYSAGVLIDEACNVLLPGHLRFVCGVVETTNIRLNVSREAIQQDSRVQIIGRQLERSVMESLKAMVDDDRPAHERFFAAYGTGVKFSICTSRGTLANVLNPLLLYPSAREGRLVSLQEYVDAIGDVKKHPEIFYAVGSDVERLRRTPAVEEVLERGHDVLLCPNGAQDEFCFMVMGSYRGARFHSVTSANLSDGDEAEPSRPAADTERVLEAIAAHTRYPLARAAASAYLAGPAKAASRVATEGVMTIAMAKYVTSRLGKDEVPPRVYVLEVNTGHALFEVARVACDAGDDALLDACATVLLGQAFLVEDIALPDPVAFNGAVDFLVARAVRVS